jgi:hypothetical protein
MRNTIHGTKIRKGLIKNLELQNKGPAGYRQLGLWTFWVVLEFDEILNQKNGSIFEKGRR